MTIHMLVHVLVTLAYKVCIYYTYAGYSAYYIIAYIYCVRYICQCGSTACILYRACCIPHTYTNILYTYTGTIYDSTSAPGGIEGYKHYISWIKRELIAGTYIYMCVYA